MGSTFVDFRGQGFEASDPALEIWLLLLVGAIDEWPSPPDWLKEVREEWHVQATAGFGFGVMPGLDNFVTTPERRDVVLDLCGKALKRLRERGPVMTAEELNVLLRGGKGTIFTEEVQTDVFERVGEYFVKLLRGELKPEECDARPGRKPRRQGE